MRRTRKFLKAVAPGVSLMIILSCNFLLAPAAPDAGASVSQTAIDIGAMATRIADQEMTLAALEAGLTAPASTAQPTGTSELPAVATATPRPPEPPGQPSAASPAALVLEMRASVDEFYCYDSPLELTITVRVSDIERGLAIYYHIRDKKSGVASDPQVLDLHRSGADTRSATIIGGGSEAQNLQFPPLMGESYFVYQIVSDDGMYRSPVYQDITFFPCAQ